MKERRMKKEEEEEEEEEETLRLSSKITPPDSHAPVQGKGGGQGKVMQDDPRPLGAFKSKLSNFGGVTVMTVGTISTEWDLFSCSLLFSFCFSFCWISVFSFSSLYLCFRCVWSTFFSCHRFGNVDPQKRDLSPWTMSIVSLISLNSAEGNKPEEMSQCCAEILFSISCHLHSYIFLCRFHFSFLSHFTVSSFFVSLWIFCGPCHKVCFDYSCIQALQCAGSDAVSQLDFPDGVVSQTRRAQTAREVCSTPPGPLFGLPNAHCACGFIMDKYTGSL